MPGWELKPQSHAGFGHSGVAVATDWRDTANSWGLQSSSQHLLPHPSARAQPSAPQTQPSFENHWAKTAFHDNLNALYLFLHPAFAAAFFTGSQVKYPVGHRYQQVTKMLLCTVLLNKLNSVFLLIHHTPYQHGLSVPPEEVPEQGTINICTLT